MEIWGPGSRLTENFCKVIDKPYYVVDFTVDSGEISFNDSMLDIKGWLTNNDVSTLNVAGSRESKNIGIQKATYNFLARLWETNP